MTDYQYGVRVGGVDTWPDSEGDLLVSRGDGSTRYIFDSAAKTEAELRGALDVRNPEAQLIRRAFGEPEIVTPPFPTTVGSVVRGTVAGKTSLFALTSDTDSRPWFDVGRKTDQSYAGADNLEAVEILFVAPEVAS